MIEREKNFHTKGKGMGELNSTERVMNTFEGKPLDRFPLFDIIHNVKFIEHVAGERVTPGNAEDLVCRAARETLDLVRHFCIPDDLEKHEIEDEDGFVYVDEWWTKEIRYRPIRSVEDACELMKKDMDRIYQSIERQKFCHQAKEHLNLFGEKYEYPEEVNKHFERVVKKLGDTMMIAPETVPGLYTASNRFVLMRIVLPLSAPALASCIILLFLETWNEFIYALVFLQNPEIQTIPVAIARIAGGKFRLPLGTYGAAIMITVIPVLIVFMLFQKWFIAGMTMGAVKG